MRTLVALATLTALLAAPAVAREVDRAEIFEDFAKDVPHEYRTFCSDTQMVTLADGTETRACVNWRAQVRTRLLRVYAALEGPENDTDQNVERARRCFEMAVASQNNPYREAFDQDAFLTGARAQFSLCAATTALQNANRYSLKVYDRGVWLGGS